MLLAAAARAQPDIGFYFSKTDSLSRVPEEYTKKINPTVDPGQKAYLWGAIVVGDIGPNQIGMLFEPEVSAGAMYNPSWGDKTRWYPQSDFDPVGRPGEVFLYHISPLGSDDRDPLKLLDPGGVMLHYLLGETVYPDYGVPYPVFMAIGEGIKWPRERGRVAFGFGDEWLWGDTPRGSKSRLPDLHVTPEPSGLLLLGVAVLLARRR